MMLFWKDGGIARMGLMSSRQAQAVLLSLCGLTIMMAYSMSAPCRPWRAEEGGTNEGLMRPADGHQKQ
jgi:hypothetical protein